MNDKLLRAFIEASGYEIEETKDIKSFYKADDLMSNGEPIKGAICEVISTIIDYKVTKKVASKKEVIEWIIVLMENNDISLLDINKTYYRKID